MEVRGKGACMYRRLHGRILKLRIVGLQRRHRRHEMEIIGALGVSQGLLSPR